MSPQGPFRFPFPFSSRGGEQSLLGRLHLRHLQHFVLFELCSACALFCAWFHRCFSLLLLLLRRLGLKPFRCVAEEAKLSHFLPKRYPKLGSDSRFALARFAARKARMAELKRGKRFMRATASAR